MEGQIGSSSQASFNVELRRSRTANGGFEWFLAVGGLPVYPGAGSVGLFTEPDIGAQEALRRVLAQHGRSVERGW